MSADLIALLKRLDRIHDACGDGRPRQAVGEMVAAMLDMPEWAKLAAALSSRPKEAAPSEEQDDLALLQDFADAIIGEFPDHGDVDGFALQEIAEACGLLKPEQRTVPCGDACNCTDNANDGEETTCYRIQPVLLRARRSAAIRAAATQASTQGADVST